MQLGQCEHLVWKLGAVSRNLPKKIIFKIYLEFTLHHERSPFPIRNWAFLTLFIDNLLRVGSLEYWLLGRYTAESGLSEKIETGERFKDSNQIFLQYMLMLNSAKLVQSYNCFRDIQPTPIPSVSGLWGRMCWRSSASWWAIESVFCICAKWASVINLNCQELFTLECVSKDPHQQHF